MRALPDLAGPLQVIFPASPCRVSIVAAKGDVSKSDGAGRRLVQEPRVADVDIRRGVIDNPGDEDGREKGAVEHGANCNGSHSVSTAR